MLEVLEPGGTQPVADGEKGELVVTSLTREGMPILRFRTGDLTQRGSQDGKLVLPRGVFGRTDAMVKIKGVKVYPKELLFVLAGTPGLNFRHHQLRLGRKPDGTDFVRLRVEGPAGTDVGELAVRLRRALGIGIDEIEVAPEVVGDLVVDERFG